MTNLTLFSACVCTWGVPHTFMAFKWVHVMNWWMELEDSKIIQHRSVCVMQTPMFFWRSTSSLKSGYDTHHGYSF